MEVTPENYYLTAEQLADEYSAPVSDVEFYMELTRDYDVDRIMRVQGNMSYPDYARMRTELSADYGDMYRVFNSSGSYENTDSRLRTIRKLLTDVDHYVSKYEESRRLKLSAVQESGVPADTMQSRVFSLDVKTDEICGGKVTGLIVENALLKYNESPAEDVTEEKKRLPLSKQRKSHTLTMSTAVYAVLDKLCGGEKIAATIIEVAVWRYVNNGAV